MSTLENRYFDDVNCKTKLMEHFHISSIDGLGIKKDYENGTIAAGALLIYLYETQKNNLSHIVSIKPYTTNKYMIIRQVLLGVILN